MQKNFSVSVVIPNYNGKELLAQHLPSLYVALQFANIHLAEIIIVDDASNDDSTTFISQYFPNIIIIQNEKNEGFSRTINKGIHCAKYDLIFLLNNDVLLLENYFVHLLNYFTNTTTFGVMGKIIGYHNDEIQDAAKYPAGRFYQINGSTNYYFLNKQEHPIPSFMLSGANALVSRKKIQQLGGFNEIFSPYYWEDTDLSIRAQRMGWQCFYEPKSICRHPASSTINKYSKKTSKEIIIQRNKIIIHYLHLQCLPFFIFLSLYFCKAFGSLFLFKNLYLKSLWQFCKKYKEAKKCKYDFIVKSVYSFATIKKNLLHQIGYSVQKF